MSQRFYFNIHDGVSSLDRVGTELSSVSEAQLEAVRLAGAVLCDEAARVVSRDGWHMDVIDDDGRVRFRLDVSVTDAAVLPKASSFRSAS